MGNENENEGLQRQPEFNPEAVALIIGELPGVLTRNKKSADNASAACQALLDTIEGEGMNEKLDQAANKLLVKLRDTHAIMMSGRKEGTGFMDFIKSEFTKVEAIVYNPKDAKSYYARIQKSRDDFATQRANEERDRQAAAQRKLKVDQERITIASDCELKLKQHFLDHLQKQKAALNTVFENLTLENLENETLRIRSLPETYDHKHYDQFRPTVSLVYMTSNDFETILINVKKGKFGEFNAQYNSEIVAYKHELLDKIPSKKMELEVIAEAKRKEEEAAKELEKAKSKKAKEEAAEKLRLAEEEKKRLADEAEKRKADEEERMRAEAARKSQDAVSTSEAGKQADMTNAMFEAATSMSVDQSSAQVRESFEIEIIHPLAYLQIAQFYFEKEGLTQSADKLEKKTLGSMKKFAEAYAFKNDEKISSPHLKYNEKFKTVAKKVTA